MLTVSEIVRFHYIVLTIITALIYYVHPHSLNLKRKSFFAISSEDIACFAHINFLTKIIYNCVLFLCTKFTERENKTVGFRILRKTHLITFWNNYQPNKIKTKTACKKPTLLCIDIILSFMNNVINTLW